MAAQVQHVQPQAMAEQPPACYYPTVLQGGQKYSEVADAVLAQYNDLYTDQGSHNFFTKAEEIPPLLADWKDRHNLVVNENAEDKPSMETLRQERNAKITQYVAFRHIRDETQRIIGELDTAIAYLTLPRDLDPHTIAVLQRCGINMSQVEQRIADLFGRVQEQQGVSKKDQLIAARAKLESFKTEIVKGCGDLSETLEPLAWYTADVTLGLLARASHAPYVKHYVDLHDITRHKAQQQDEEEQKS